MLWLQSTLVIDVTTTFVVSLYGDSASKYWSSGWCPTPAVNQKRQYFTFWELDSTINCLSLGKVQFVAWRSPGWSGQRKLWLILEVFVKESIGWWWRLLGCVLPSSQMFPTMFRERNQGVNAFNVVRKWGRKSGNKTKRNLVRENVPPIFIPTDSHLYSEKSESGLWALLPSVAASVYISASSLVIYTSVNSI